MCDVWEDSEKRSLIVQLIFCLKIINFDIFYCLSSVQCIFHIFVLRCSRVWSAKVFLCVCVLLLPLMCVGAVFLSLFRALNCRASPQIRVRGKSLCPQVWRCDWMHLGIRCKHILEHAWPLQCVYLYVCEIMTVWTSQSITPAQSINSASPLSS